MKSLTVLCLTVLLCIRSTAAELSIWQIESSRKEGVTEVPGQSGFKILLGAQLLVMKSPAELTLGNRRTLSRSGRHGTYNVGDSPHLTIPLGKDQLEKLASVLPQDRTTSLAIVVDGFAIGQTPYTRDWRKWGCGVDPGSLLLDSEVVKKLKAAEVKIIDKVSLNSPDFAGAVRSSEGGAIEDLICRGKADNPLETQIHPPQKTVFCHEPVQAALSFKNIGIDQAKFKVALQAPGELSANLRALSGKVLTANPNHKTPERGENRIWLSEGDSSSVDANLTRVMGCEYAQAGTGPLALQYRLVTSIPFKPFGRHNYDAWLDLPTPEMKVVTFEEEKFQLLQTVTVAGVNDAVRLGTHPLEGKPVTVAMYSKGGVVRRILRLDPNPDTKTWEMAWDAKAQQLHILGHGLKARYWMSAADQLGWEVRADVADRSKLETTDGQVRRVD